MDGGALEMNLSDPISSGMDAVCYSKNAKSVMPIQAENTSCFCPALAETLGLWSVIPPTLAVLLDVLNSRLWPQ